MDSMTWLNEPPAWHQAGDQLVAIAGPRTDFWQKTSYGFVRDNGHIFGRLVAGNAVAEVTVRGAYATLYDQAGLGLRRDAEHWIKCGVELVDGMPHASVVVTRGSSDWSIIALPPTFEALSLRLVRTGEVVEIFWSLGGAATTLLRLSPFPPGPALLGALLAAPDGEGFEARFDGLSVRET